MALGFVRSTVELSTCGRGITPVRGFDQLTCQLLYRLALMLLFGLCVWKWTSSVTTLDHNQNCSIGFDGSVSGIAQSLACTRKLGKCRRSEGLHRFNFSKGTNLPILIILAGDIEMNPGLRSLCRLCKKYCKASEKSVKYETRSMAGILGQLKWESLKKRRKDNRLILLYKGLKGKARIPTDDLIPKTRCGRNQHSLAFQIPSVSKDVYTYSFFSKTIRGWNDLPESLISSFELSDDRVSKFTSLVRARD